MAIIYRTLMKIKEYNNVLYYLAKVKAKATLCCSVIICGQLIFPYISYSNETVRAQLVPRKAATLSSGLTAKISRMPLHKGDSFHKGDLLVAFDCTVEKAQQQRAQAKRELNQKIAEVNKRLAQLQSISVLEVEKSVAEAKTSKADLAVMDAVIKKCNIVAPFPGKVVDLYARQYQFVSAGNRLLEIIDVDDLEVEIIIPSVWLSWLKPGAGFLLRIDETGKKYKAEVNRIGAAIDPVSQSLTIMARIKDNPKGLLPGMSGVAYFQAVGRL